MKSAHVIAGVTVVLAGVAVAIWSGEHTPRPSPGSVPVPVPGSEPAPEPVPVHVPDARSLADQAAAAHREGKLDLALELYGRSLALHGDRDVAAARDRVRKAIEARTKGFEADQREEERRGVLAEAARLEQAGRLPEALAKYDEGLAMGEDDLARESRARVARRIEERAKEEAEAKVRGRFDALVDGARQLATAGEPDKALAKYDEALAVRDDAAVRAERAEVARQAKVAAFRATWGFVPKADELHEEDRAALVAAGELFLRAWADREDPDRALDARKKDAEAADKAWKELPDRLRKHAVFTFLNGALHFLVAMGIYDDFLLRRGALHSLDEQELLTKETLPIYNSELETAERRLREAREATDGHFAACVFEDLSRAWRSDKDVSKAGKKSLAADYEAIEPLTPFDAELKEWVAKRGLFRQR